MHLPWLGRVKTTPTNTSLYEREELNSQLKFIFAFTGKGKVGDDDDDRKRATKIPTNESKGMMFGILSSW